MPLGDPISSELAAHTVLKLLDTPILGDIDKEGTGWTLSRIFQERPEGVIYDMLSGGEKKLVDIASTLWNGSNRAPISHLGGLDRDLRRKVWIILGYYYLGRDVLSDEGLQNWSKI